MFPESRQKEFDLAKKYAASLPYKEYIEGLGDTDILHIWRNYCRDCGINNVTGESTKNKRLITV